MHQNSKGFTLLELLIAATIIGILAVFATVSYRNSAADTRVAGAKAKLEVLANAVQRYNVDPTACQNITSSTQITMGGLGSCGLLESEIFRESDGYFVFQICNGSSASLCKDTTYLACMSVDGDKLPGRYLAKNG